MLIRHGFETNSSSSHSLVISPDNDVLTDVSKLGVYEDSTEGRKFIVSGNTKFGWEWEIWDYPGDKLFYILIDGASEELTNEMRQMVATKAEVEFKNVIFDGIDNCNDNYSCYIDHQSLGTSSDVRRMETEEIWQFIMNPNSCFRGGNDNQCGPWSYNDNENEKLNP